MSSIQIFKHLAFTLILEAALTVKKSPQLFITNQDVHNVTSDSEVNYMFRQYTRYSFKKITLNTNLVLFSTNY